MEQKILSFNKISKWAFVISTIFFVACQSNAAINTPTIQVTAVTKAFGPTVTSTSEMWTLTPIPTPEILITPTTSPTAFNLVTSTPVITVTTFRKTDELPISAVYFTVSKDGSLLAVVNQKTGILRVFDTSNWNKRWEIEETGRGMTGYTLDFSPNGNLLAGGGDEQDVFVWDMNNGETRHILPEPYDSVNSVTFSSDGKFLAASTPEDYSSKYRIMVWNVETGELVSQFPAGEYGWYVTDISYIPNKDNLIAITTANFNLPEDFDEDDRPGGLYTWDVANQHLQEITPGTYGLVVETSPNGQFIAAYIDGNLQVWDIVNMTPKLSVMPSEVADTDIIAITDEGIVANLDASGILTLWNLQGELLTTQESEKRITDVAFTPHGELMIAYLADDSPIELWQFK